MDNLHYLFVMPNARVTTTPEKLNDFLALIEQRYGAMLVRCKGIMRRVTWARIGNMVAVSTYEIE